MKWFHHHKISFLSLLLHPFFIGFLISLFILFIWRVSFQKYEIRLVEEVDSRSSFVFYADIDNDTVSERLRFDTNDSLQVSLIIYEDWRIRKQINIHHKEVYGRFFYTGDYNNDQQLEIYLITRNRDSIFLNIVEPGKADPFLVRDRFIDFIGQNPHSFNVPNAMPVGLVHAGGKTRDFIFGINTGYSKQPRNIYRYMIDADSLLKSPESGASLGDIRLIDLDQDSIPEIVLTTRATGNFDENKAYTDQVAWLMAMDINLRFIFPPVACGPYPGNAELEIVHENNQPLFAVWYKYSGTGADSTALLVFDATGKKLKRRDLNTGEHSEGSLLRNSGDLSDVFFLLNTRTGQIEAYNSSLKQTSQYPLPGKFKLMEQSLMDLDNDGREELVLTNYPEKLIVIKANDFRHYAVYNYPEGQDVPLPSLVQRGAGNTHLYLQFKDFGQILSFERNPWYWLRLVWPPGLYLGISFFLLGMFRIQRYRANLAHEREKKIVALQMKALRNQIDPHFTFNIINAMGGLYLSGTDKEEAYDIFVNYANFLRQMIISSDQVSVSLENELEFVQNFIDIEKTRCDNSFEYSTEIDPSVDLQTRIPRTLIFTFVENAIKYGIRCRKGRHAFIRVTIVPEKKQIKMIIENSGPGINHPGDKNQGTGRGLAILREMADLYEKLEGKKVSFRLEDVLDDEGKVMGTRGVVGFG